MCFLFQITDKVNMDVILRGLLSSDKKESIKKTIVNKIARNGSDPKQSTEIQKSSFCAVIP